MDYFGARYYDSRLGFWTSVDPLVDKNIFSTPYSYCNGNPVMLIDPDGRSYSEFDEDGNYLRTTHDNWWHNTFIGQKGRVLDSKGSVVKSFEFADPKNDVANLKAGNLEKLQFVKEEDIRSMLETAGAFDPNNSTANASLWNRYKYIFAEGKGGGKLDFAMSAKGIGTIYGMDTYKSLYLVDGVAHNPKNFGNFLFGAAGASLGYWRIELLGGAHYNSLFHPESNGYKPQLDSKDDQLSINLGVLHAISNKYPIIISK